LIKKFTSSKQGNGSSKDIVMRAKENLLKTDPT